MMPMLDAAVRFTLAVLFNGLWEAALLAVVAWVALRAMPNGNATTRHTVLAAALFASLILPVATTVVTTMPQAFVTSAPSTAVPAPGMPAAKPANAARLTQAGARTSHGALALPPAAQTQPAQTQAARSVTRLNLTLPRAVALALVAVWLIGAAFVLIRLFVSLLHLERLKVDALPVPVEYRAQLLRWSAATKGSRTVRLCRSSEIVIPIAVGLFDAMILVPDRLLEELTPADIDRIVLHELAHLRRADDWINAVERVAQALLFFNPGISWLVSQLDLEREVACDDWVLQQNEALPYATCLAKVVETTTWPYRAMSAPGAFVTRRGMSIRIERLLSSHRDVRVRTSLGPTGLAIAVLGALSIVAAFVSPSIAYTTPAAPAIAAKRPAPPKVAQAPQKSVKPAPAVQHVQPGAPSAKASAVAAATAKPQIVASAVATPAVASAAAKPPAVTNAQTRVAVATSTHAAVAVASNVAVAPKPGEAGDERAVRVAANSPGYIDELAAVGYTNLSIDELVQLRSVGVTASYIRQLQTAGLSHPSVQELIRLRALGVAPEYIHAMRDRFGSSLPLDEVVSMKAVGVTPEYVEQLNAAGLKNLSADRVRSLRALGVTPDYVRELARAGYPNLTVDQIQQMRALGIDAAFINSAAAHGFHNLSVDQLVRLKVSGIL